MEILHLGGVEQYARRSKLIIIYEGQDITSEITESILGCSYRDSINEFDTIELTLEDRKGLWMGSWAPLKGDKLQVKFQMIDWKKTGIIEHNLGDFYIDDIGYNGPPQVVTLRGVSVDIASNIMDSREYKSWEDVTLEEIAKDISEKCGIEVECDFDFNRTYKRVEQKLESDYTLLKRLCREAGVTVKLYSNRLILFEESEYEKRDPQISLSKLDCKDYSFNIQDADTYSSCKISYYDYILDENIEHTFKTKNRVGYKKNTQRILFLNYDAAVPGETLQQKKEYLLKVAEKELREKNKSETLGSVTLMGTETQLSASDVISLHSFGRFDGSYIITDITTEFAQYEQTLTIRRCLEGY